MYPRKQLDIRWSDIARAVLYCIFPGDIRARESELEELFASPLPVLTTLTVRSGFDLCLQALSFPRGSEILMSALTIPEMADIARHNGLVPIPLDLDRDTLAPAISTIEAAITDNTRALVIAHLFGTRIPMEPVIAIAKKRDIFVIEDCAQAFTGSDYTGHPQTNAAMFSFGSIKTATALGGALIRLRDSELLRKMRLIQRSYPMQTRKEFQGILLTHVILKLFTIPLLFGLFYRGCVFLGADFESVITAVRGRDPEDWLKEIRKCPSFPLLSLLAHRLRTFDSARIMQRTEVGQEFAQALPREVLFPGNQAQFHSFWVFPVLVNAREQFMKALHSRGFDGTATGSALSVIDPPPGRENLDPAETRSFFGKLLYLPVYPQVPRRERDRLSKAIAGILGDSAHLQITDARGVYGAVAQTIESPRSIADIRNALQRAQRDGAPVCMMGTRHNLGGHAFVSGAMVLDMTHFNRVRSLDIERKRITVESGITWERIQEKVNPAGLAVKTMQSDNIFTVGGSLASNVHGRDTRFPTLVESVIGFRLMLADGSVISVSRSENPDFFSDVIGGYGLFGVILDVDLALVDDCVYEQVSVVIPLSGLVEYFEREIRSNLAAELFIARPCICPRYFLEDTIVTVWKRVGKARKGMFQLDHERHVARDRFLFGLSRRYTWGKTLRWYAEKHISLRPSHKGIVSRNNAMRPPVSSFKMFECDWTKNADVIQEFFIPIPRFMTFVEGTQAILQDGTNLLGVTIRYVKANNETALSYTPRQDAFAVVIYFNEVRSSEGRAKAGALITRLTGLALNCGGTFYLSYIRDIEIDCLRQAYAGVDAFFQRKRLADPENRFTSRFFEVYGKAAKLS